MKEFDPDLMPNWLATLWPRSDLAPGVVAGVNDDDCAVLEFGTQILVVTTDFLNRRPIVEELGLGGIKAFGKLVVAANLSDLLGSGARPLGLLIGAAMAPGDTDEDFREFTNGVFSEAARWQVPILGGDTKIGNARSFFGVGIGIASRKDNIFLKSWAKPGEILWVSGPIGGCAAATLGFSKLRMQREWKIAAKEAVIEPNLPLAKSRAISDESLGRAGIDISDGIANDLARLCSASSVGAILNLESLPLHPVVPAVAEGLGLPAWAIAFGSGGDFQFLVTTSPEAKERMVTLGFVEIGVITAGANFDVVNERGDVRRFSALGHRDSRKLTFSEEVEYIAREAARIEAI